MLGELAERFPVTRPAISRHLATLRRAGADRASRVGDFVTNAAMKEFRTTISIQSTPEKVWAILTDASAYPSWNTTVTKVDGTIAVGQKVTVHAKISPNQAFPVRVAVLEPQRRMVWRGGMPIGFLFKGERTFTISPAGEGEVEFAMREVFSGLFSGMITKSIPDLTPAFDEFAACLKKRAEA